MGYWGDILWNADWKYSLDRSNRDLVEGQNENYFY